MPLRSRALTITSLGGAADYIPGEDVATATNGEPDAEKVVLKDVIRYVGVEGLKHCQSRVAVVVDVVAWREDEIELCQVRPKTQKRQINCLLLRTQQHILAALVLLGIAAIVDQDITYN